MASITFRLSDFGLESLAEFNPIVKFIPSQAGVSGDRLLTTTPIVVTPDPAGIGAVVLTDTDTVTPGIWYEVVIEHLMPGDQYKHFDHLPLRFYVPTGYNGPLSGLPGRQIGTNAYWFSLDPPPAGFQGLWIYTPAPGQTMPEDDDSIGDVRVVA